MAAENVFGHDGVDGTPTSRASWACYGRGFPTWSIGEILGFDTGRLSTAKAIFKAWLGRIRGSPCASRARAGHRR